MPVSVAQSSGENPLAKKVYEFKSLRPCDLNGCTRKEIKEYFENTYDLDEFVFAGIKEEKSFYLCPDRLRLPLIFYVAHPATLYINKLLLAGMITKRVNRHFEALFETGVDEMSWDDTENYRMGGSYQWPSLADVLEYRRQVREVVIDVIKNAPLEFPITQESPWWSLFMGMEHERIHLETSSVLIRQLPADSVQKPTNWIYAPMQSADPAGPNELVTVPEGKVTFGKPVDFPSYGWDNEYGQVTMNVPKFEASRYLITNDEFLEFVNAGGYKKKEFWTAEGWKWVKFCKAKHPTFWVCQDGCKSRCGAALAGHSHCQPSKGAEIDNTTTHNGSVNGMQSNGTNGVTMQSNGTNRVTMQSNGTNGVTMQSNGTNGVTMQSNGTNGVTMQSNGTNGVSHDKYRYRAMYDVIDMPWDWPVDVNYHEAKAFCKWKGPEYRLPTEAEHNRIRGDPAPSADILCDPVYRMDTNANIQFKYGSSNPVNLFPPTALGFYDVYGNVWDWVEDHFNGLPSFEVTYLYNDFSTPCFDGRHTMIMGGSWVSTGSSEASRFARYAFRRHFFQHAGFRVVKSTENAPVRLCNCEVFVLGVGVEENPVLLPACDTKKSWVPSTNDQFQFEVESHLSKLLEEQYGEGNEMTNSLVTYYESVVSKYGCGKASTLHLGCGPGYTSLMLSKTFDSVTGVDYCGRFINTAMQIQNDGVVKFGTGKEAKLPDGVKPKNVNFVQLTWLPNEVENHSFVLVEFLDRVLSSKSWLVKLWECISSDGMMVLCTSNKWKITTLSGEVGKWFDMVENSVQGDKLVTVWKMKN